MTGTGQQMSWHPWRWNRKGHEMRGLKMRATCAWSGQLKMPHFEEQPFQASSSSRLPKLNSSLFILPKGFLTDSALLVCFLLYFYDAFPIDRHRDRQSGTHRNAVCFRCESDPAWLIYALWHWCSALVGTELIRLIRSVNKFKVQARPHTDSFEPSNSVTYA